MKFFGKKETLAQNMAFMGIMSSINIILSLIISFQPILSIFLVLALPLVSALVELSCKDKYYLIYALSSVGLALVATLWNIQSTIFYLIPSIITGYIFGLMIKKNVYSLWTILIASLIQMFLTFMSIFVIYWIYQQNIIYDILIFFKLAQSPFILDIVPTIIFTISLIQIVLSYMITIEESKKFGYQTDDNILKLWIYELITLVLTLSIIPFSFFNDSISYFILAISLFFAIYLIVEFSASHNWKALIIFGVALTISIFIFAIFYLKLPNPKGLLLIGTFPLQISISALPWSILKKRKDNNTIIN